MSALIIGENERRAIREAIDRARARPIPWEVLRRTIPSQNEKTDTLMLADRPPETVRPQAEIVELPTNFRLNISFEEQPAGICIHLSISVGRKNKLPSPDAVAMILGECGVDPMTAMNPRRAWVEEFLLGGEPGGLAINIVAVTAPAKEGHA